MTMTAEAGALPARLIDVAGGGRSPAIRDAFEHTALVDAYGAHREAAYRTAYGILGDAPASEDAVQDVFLKFWTASRFDASRGSLHGLLMTITRHTSIDVIRRRARRQRTEGRYCADAEWTSDGPEQAMVRGEDERSVRSALLALPEAQRDVIELVYFSGLTHCQIAAKIAIPVGTVKSRLRLGMRKLALVLGPGRIPRPAPIAHAGSVHSHGSRSETTCRR